METFDKFEYVCGNCNNGKVCSECFINICDTKINHELINDFYFYNHKININSDEIDELHQLVKCPCCRVNNYKHLFSYVINELEDIGDYTDMEEHRYNVYRFYKRKPVFKKIFKAQKKLNNIVWDLMKKNKNIEIIKHSYVCYNIIVNE
jgi:hypothetical protein